jgi:hypothetical protein
LLRCFSGGLPVALPFSCRCDRDAFLYRGLNFSTWGRSVRDVEISVNCLHMFLALDSYLIRLDGWCERATLSLQGIFCDWTLLACFSSLRVEELQNIKITATYPVLLKTHVEVLANLNLLLVMLPECQMGVQSVRWVSTRHVCWLCETLTDNFLRTWGWCDKIRGRARFGCNSGWRIVDEVGFNGLRRKRFGRLNLSIICWQGNA